MAFVYFITAEFLADTFYMVLEAATAAWRSPGQAYAGHAPRQPFASQPRLRFYARIRPACHFRLYDTLLFYAATALARRRACWCRLRFWWLWHLCFIIFISDVLRIFRPRFYRYGQQSLLFFVRRIQPAGHELASARDDACTDDIAGAWISTSDAWCQLYFRMLSDAA